MADPRTQLEKPTDRPVLSVVIPSYQSEEFLEECLKSIEASTDNRVEYIFIDGGSTDRTISIIEGHKKSFSHVLSEPDNGQSSALNKGFHLARGRYLTWLNADDVLLPGAMVKVLRNLEKGDWPWYACNQVYLNPENRIIRVLESGKFEKFSWRFGALHVFGPSTIFAKSLYEEIGPLKEDFKFCMDYEYWYRLCSTGHRYVRLPVHLWGFRVHGGSKTSGSLGKETVTPRQMMKEQKLIRDQYLNKRSLHLKKLILMMVRVKRFITGPYYRSWLLTARYRDVPYWEFNEN